MYNIINGKIKIDSSWNDGESKELLMHKIHPYPAKFPAFIAQKAFQVARDEGVNVNTVADVFCGCGTVALESKVQGIDFWGCDINPVATLIARTKSQSYRLDTLDRYYNIVFNNYKSGTVKNDSYENTNERIRYWFTEKSFSDLSRLKNAITGGVGNRKYRDAFLCLFSAILKTNSRWLTKSIKPQIDPEKINGDVWESFDRQYDLFYKAVIEAEDYKKIRSSVRIETGNFLTIDDMPMVDMIVSSPPYVTSYEYADLHQLSTLWIGYTDDYRSFRNGTVGSVYNCEKYAIDRSKLNIVGRRIVGELENKLGESSKTKAVARYYSDIQTAVSKCARSLKNRGMILFVVGDTEYKGIPIKNSEHLMQSMRDEGFVDIKAAKRKISKKILTPYRDEKGKFTSDKTSRKIYHEEFVICGRKNRDE